MERIDLPITGMSCASCAAKIEKGLARVEGVSEANVNFAAERAMVLFNPNLTDLPHLIQKVKDLGYEAKVEKVILPVQGMTCASCVKKVEKALNSAKGVVQAGVNFATERATVEYVPEVVTIRDLRKVVEEAGYQVLEVKIGDSTLREEDIVEKERFAREAELLKLKQKFIIGAVFLAPILILMYGASLLGDKFLYSISIGHSCPILGRPAVLCWLLEGDQTQDQRYEHLDRCGDLCGLSL